MGGFPQGEGLVLLGECAILSGRIFRLWMFMAFLGATCGAFLGCAPTSNFGTAKMAGPGKIQVASHGTLYSGGDSAFRHTPNGPGSFGGSFAVGISRKFNLRARYDRVALESRPEPDSLPERTLENALGLEMKFSQDGRTLATSLGLQYYPGDDIQVASSTFYTNWYPREDLFLCVSPYVNAATVRGRLVGFTAAINISLTYVFGKIFYLRPELGTPILVDSPDLFRMNLGLAIGLEL